MDRAHVLSSNTYSHVNHVPQKSHDCISRLVHILRILSPQTNMTPTHGNETQGVMHPPLHTYPHSQTKQTTQMIDPTNVTNPPKTTQRIERTIKHPLTIPKTFPTKHSGGASAANQPPLEWTASTSTLSSNAPEKKLATLPRRVPPSPARTGRTMTTATETHQWTYPTTCAKNARKITSMPSTCPMKRMTLQPLPCHARDRCRCSLFVNAGASGACVYLVHSSDHNTVCVVLSLFSQVNPPYTN